MVCRPAIRIEILNKGESLMENNDLLRGKRVWQQRHAGVSLREVSLEFGILESEAARFERIYFTHIGTIAAINDTPVEGEVFPISKCMSLHVEELNLTRRQRNGLQDLFDCFPLERMPPDGWRRDSVCPTWAGLTVGDVAQLSDVQILRTRIGPKTLKDIKKKIYDLRKKTEEEQ